MNAKWLLGCICAASMLMATATISAYADETVTIKDPILSNTIHDALGVDRWEPLTSEQLAGVTELTIDEGEFQNYYDWKTGRIREGFYLDLSEIGSLVNLESLRIDNHVEGPCPTFIYGLTGLTDCANLKNVSIPYNTNEPDDELRKKMEAGGTKTLVELAAGCESLEVLDLGILPPQEVIDRIHEANPDIEVTGMDWQLGEEEEHAHAYGEFLQAASTDELTACSDPESITSLIITGNCDLSSITNMPNLKTLVITGYVNGLSKSSVEVTNFEAVKELPHLSTLSLNVCSIDADVQILNEIPGLTSLTYTDMSQPLPAEMDVYGQLTEFVYKPDTQGSEASAAELPDLTAMKNLVSLGYYADDLETFGEMQGALEGSGVRRLYVYVRERTASEQTASMVGFDGMKELRYLTVNGGVTKSITWEGAQGLENLEVLNVYVKNDFPGDLTIYPQLRKLNLVFIEWTQNNMEGDVDLASAQNLEHLSFLGTGELRESDYMRFDLTVFGKIKGLAALHENGVDIDLLNMENFADRILAELT